MFAYHVKSFFRDLVAAIRGDGPWFEVRYHWASIWSEIFHPFRAFWYGLENLYAYLPIIWLDRDWDYAYMLTLWELKFRRMARNHLLYGNHLRHEEVAQELRVCAQLCARIRDDNYADAGQEAHDKKWGRAEMVILPKDDPKQPYVRTRFIRERVETDAEAAQEREEFLRYVKHAEQQREADLKYLGNLIATRTLCWWD
jgi:hypothetical protein